MNTVNETSFERFLEGKSLIPHTIARHKRERARYERWLEDACGKRAENASTTDLLQYLGYIKTSRGLTNASQNQILQNLKNYHEWLALHHGITDIGRFIKIRGTRRKRLRYQFTHDELDSLCDAYYRHTLHYIPTAKQLRYYPDYAGLLRSRYIALTLFAYQGLQIHEIQSLTSADFNLHKGYVTVSESLHGAHRKLPLDISQVGLLSQHFADDGTPSLPNANQFERLNVTLKTLHPKYEDFTQIRTSKIVHWIRQYGLRKAQYLAGHKSIGSTEQYLPGDFESLRNDMDAFHPLG